MKIYAELYGDIKKPGIKSPGGNILDKMADIISLCKRASIGSVSAALTKELSNRENRTTSANLAVSALNNIATTSLLDSTKSIVEKEGELLPTFGVIQRKDTG